MAEADQPDGAPILLQGSVSVDWSSGQGLGRLGFCWLESTGEDFPLKKPWKTMRQREFSSSSLRFP